MEYSTYKHKYSSIIFILVYIIKQTTVSTFIYYDQKVNRKACIKHDSRAYIIDTNNHNNLSYLELWRANGGKYRTVARVAQKWLAFLTTSTPSERVLLICGLVYIAKRSNILGVSFEKQVFCYNNTDKFH